MESVLGITILGTIVGILGTGLGGFIALTLVRPDKRLLSVLLGLTSGLMIVVVTFDLIPESINIGGLGASIFGIVLGILIILIIEGFLPKDLGHNGMSEQSGFIKAGYLVGIGIAIHNLPEGLAIGSSFAFTTEMGLKMALVISLHNLPEGISMATPLRIGGFPRLKVMLLTLASGVPTGIGTFIGALLGNMSNFFISICLALAGGTMLYITCGELIPNAKTLHSGRASTLGVIAGFLLGMLFIID